MTTHLAPAEFVDAVEGALASTRQRHLDDCDECRREVSALASIMGGIQATVPVPEPSPLFWEHLSRRVRAATDADAIQPQSWLGASWWSSLRRPLVTITAAAAVVLVSLVVRVHSPAAVRSEGAVVAAGSVASSEAEATEAVPPAAPAAQDDAMDFVTQLASDVPWDELRQVAEPTRDVTSAALDQLTPAQRVEFARMIKAAMGGVE